VKIKICGLFREDDIGYVNEARPDYIGFVFAESRRRVSVGFAAKLREKLDAGIVPVGVFVDARAEEIAALYHDGIIAMAQLHGGEDDRYIAALKDLTAGTGGIPVIKALQAETFTAKAALPGGADYLLLDHGAGGTGRSFEWGMVEKLRKTGLLAVPAQANALPASPRPWFLAGGIGPHNIEGAVLLRPFGIDVSSGAEKNRLKDREKILQLVDVVRKYRGGEGVI
jgi:phosphoribosylanthranilate isomerase